MSAERRVGQRKRKTAPLRPPSSVKVAEAAFNLARQLSLDLGEEELVAAFAEVLRRLFPGRWLCLRVVEPRGLTLSSLVAEGPLPLGSHAALARDPLCLRPSVLETTRLRHSVAASGRVKFERGYRPLFAGAQAGFAVPLVAAGELFGMLNVEYAKKAARLAEADERRVIPLANALSVALRNLDLFAEARYYRDFLEQTIEVADALITVVDRQGKIRVANAAMVRYSGLHDAVGLELEQLMKRREVPEPRLGTMLRDGLRGVEHRDKEVWLMRADGKVGRAVFNTSILRAPDGSIDGVIAVGQEKDRVRSLEHQVIQAEKLATLGQLAAGVVHELNNPLTAISVYGDYLWKLLEHGADQRLEVSLADVDKARKIVEGAARLQKLTRDLVSYARPGGGFEQVSVNEVVRQALSFCEHVVRRAEARLVLELAEGLPAVDAIRSQLHQVLINLVTNACHALPAPELEVRVATRLGPGGVELVVADAGIGIEPADLERIFEPFFTTKQEGKGTGLGLSIVKNIVEAHHGAITCDSQPGHGTTFTVTLPPAD
jgi:PAS domain S-box-containing protein